MVNAEKIKKRFYIFLVFYVLFGIALSSILDRELSSDFKQKYKIILFVIEVFFMNLPMLLALIINNYIAKNVNVNIKMYKSDKIKMYNYSKLI